MLFEFDACGYFVLFRFYNVPRVEQLVLILPLEKYISSNVQQNQQ